MFGWSVLVGNLQLFTASVAAPRNNGFPEMMPALMTSPSAFTTNHNFTTPSTRAFRAVSGYTGSIAELGFGATMSEAENDVPATKNKLVNIASLKTFTITSFVSH